MTTLPAPADAIAESQRLIAALEQRRAELPFADDMLATHRTMHRELEMSHTTSQQAVAEWRAALARRWECEVAGRKLYKQVMRQLVDYYGSPEAAPVTLVSRGGAEAESSPSELLEDLRRLHAALLIEDAPPFAEQRRAEVTQAHRDLEAAIAHANACEHRRRTAVLDSRMVREVYRRVRSETYRALVGHYGQAVPPVFEGLLDG
ncbi:MAG: hypothetical protein DIU80_016015 [Chloroflexota bacterium]